MSPVEPAMNNKTLDKNKVVLGISGGVDSTTAALLLKEQGYIVYGMYFDVLGRGPESSETKAARLAFDEAGCMGTFHYIDASKEFDSKIINNFCDEYTKGRTPNPCIICNPNIKFKYLIEVANKVGAYHIATGHYAKVYHSLTNGLSYIMASESKKDQSYMLYRLPSDLISRLILPLGTIENKETVREIAENNGMTNAKKADSQEICFIDDDVDYVDYISERLQKKIIVNQGDFVDKQGNVLGKHKGIIHYTIGQRKGLGIALGRPVFVTDIDYEKNTVTLGENEDLFTRKVYSTGNFFTETGGTQMPSSLENKRLTAKIRYAARKAAATVSTVREATGEFGPGSGSGAGAGTETNVLADVPAGVCTAGGEPCPNMAFADLVLTVFDEPQRAPSPGQSIVFYDGDLIVGGGFIANPKTVTQNLCQAVPEIMP